jgi:threonine synthase
VFAWAEIQHAEAVRGAMVAAFTQHGMQSDSWISSIENYGARVVKPDATPRYVSSRGAAPPVTLERGDRARLAPDGGLYVPSGCRRSTWPRSSARRPSRALPGLARMRWRLFRGRCGCEPSSAHRGCGARPPGADDRASQPAPIRCSRSSCFTARRRHSRISARASSPRACSGWKRGGAALTILVATSGDTGGAVAAAFHRRPWVGS